MIVAPLFSTGPDGYVVSERSRGKVFRYIFSNFPRFAGASWTVERGIPLTVDHMAISISITAVLVLLGQRPCLQTRLLEMSIRY